MEILKTIFGKDRNDKWAIREMLSVPLNPENPNDSDFYALKDDLLHNSRDHIGTIAHTVGQSIVPIVCFNNEANEISCLGTGFFISTTGLLITAAHVLSDIISKNQNTPENERPEIGVVLRNHPVFEAKGFKVVPLEWAVILGQNVDHPLPFMPAELKLTTDIALCKFASLPDGSGFQPLSIIQPGILGVGIGTGKKATAIGYGSMAAIELDPRTGKVIGDPNFQLHVSKGAVLGRFPNNGRTADVPSPGATFTASLRLPSGMSGSPIFDDEGIYVHGVASRGGEDESFGYGAMLAEFLPVKIASLGNMTLLEVLQRSDHGMPILQIAGG